MNRPRYVISVVTSHRASQL